MYGAFRVVEYEERHGCVAWQNRNRPLLRVGFWYCNTSQLNCDEKILGRNLVCNSRYQLFLSFAVFCTTGNTLIFFPYWWLSYNKLFSLSFVIKNGNHAIIIKWFSSRMEEYPAVFVTSTKQVACTTLWILGRFWGVARGQWRYSISGRHWASPARSTSFRGYPTVDQCIQSDHRNSKGSDHGFIFVKNVAVGDGFWWQFVSGLFPGCTAWDIVLPTGGGRSS